MPSNVTNSRPTQPMVYSTCMCFAYQHPSDACCLGVINPCKYIKISQFRPPVLTSCLPAYHCSTSTPSTDSSTHPLPLVFALFFYFFFPTFFALGCGCPTGKKGGRGRRKGVMKGGRERRKAPDQGLDGASLLLRGNNKKEGRNEKRRKKKEERRSSGIGCKNKQMKLCTSFVVVFVVMYVGAVTR